MEILYNQKMIEKLVEKCDLIVAREFWVDDELVDPCCILFIRSEAFFWHQLSYCDENEKWTYSSMIDAPDLQDITDQNIKYTHSFYFQEKTLKCKLVEFENDCIDVLIDDSKLLELSMDEDKDFSQLKTFWIPLEAQI